MQVEQLDDGLVDPDGGHHGIEGGEAEEDAEGRNDELFLEPPTKRRKQCAPQRREQFVEAIGNGNVLSADEVECFVRFIHKNNYNSISQL